LPNIIYIWWVFLLAAENSGTAEIIESLTPLRATPLSPRSLQISAFDQSSACHRPLSSATGLAAATPRPRGEPAAAASSPPSARPLARRHRGRAHPQQCHGSGHRMSAPLWCCPPRPCMLPPGPCPVRLGPWLSRITDVSPWPARLGHPLPMPGSARHGSAAHSPFRTGPDAVGRHCLLLPTHAPAVLCVLSSPCRYPDVFFQMIM
jgi:hypothetical protein